jgi:hypothetical protein
MVAQTTPALVSPPINKPTGSTIGCRIGTETIGVESTTQTKPHRLKTALLMATKTV